MTSKTASKGTRIRHALESGTKLSDAELAEKFGATRQYVHTIRMSLPKGTQNRLAAQRRRQRKEGTGIKVQVDSAEQPKTEQRRNILRRILSKLGV